VRRFGYAGRVVHVGHHVAHAASAFYPSGFDRAAILTLDRGGDFLSTTLGRGEGTKLFVDREVRNPDSLGEIYTAVTWFVGFLPNSDEGKVMGLAPYGRLGGRSTNLRCEPHRIRGESTGVVPRGVTQRRA
jgi:carbamoyltransferase